MGKSVSFLAYSGSVGAATYSSAFDVGGYNKISVLIKCSSTGAGGYVYPQVSLATSEGQPTSGSFVNMNRYTYLGPAPGPDTATWTGTYLADPNGNHPDVNRTQAQPICGKWGRLYLTEGAVVSAAMQVWVCLSE